MEKIYFEERVIIIFYRNPVLGKVKTRLAAGIGESAALAVHNWLSELTCRIVSSVHASRIVFYDQTVIKNDLWDDRLFLKDVQREGDLGIKMFAAFDLAFARGFKKAIIVGTDCPELKVDLIESAFQQLDFKDVVIGPALDGGYYLLGLKKPTKTLFEEITWGSDQVFQQTVAKASGHGLDLFSLIPLRDIDRPTDLDDFDIISLTK